MKRLMTLSCLLVSIIASSQSKMSSRDSVLVEYHISQGDPVFNEEPVLLMPDEVFGWTNSLDNQWLKDENKIPIYALSTDRKTMESKEANLGLDNFKHMAFYSMTIDTNEFLVFVKQFEQGSYEFPLTQTGWKTNNVLYYCVIPRPELTDSIASLPVDTNLNYGFRIFDEGLIKNVSGRAFKNPWKYISREMLFEKTDRKLVIQLEKKDQGQLRFMIYSIHPVFHDPMSLVTDWKVKNRSVYADKETLYRMHYTILDSEWSATVLP